MGQITRGEDFTDDQLNLFLGAIERLDFTIDPSTPGWVREEAAAYSRRNPKPSLRELRMFINHETLTSMGWDDPDDPRKMLHGALKMFYTLDWLEHLRRAAERGKQVAEIQLALKVKLTPNFTSP